MADKRITELNPLVGSGVNVEVDVLAIADVSAAETKKITPKDLVGTALGQLPSGSINGDVILDGSISGLKLEENSVTNRELAPDAVDTENILDASVTNEKLADGIDGGKLVDGSVSADKLEPGAISDAAITDRSLPAIKLQLNTLTADEIGPDAVGTSELQVAAVGTNELQDDACSTPKYQNLSVTNEKLADGIDGSKLVDGSVDASKLSGGIDGGQIDSIGLDKLPNAGPNTVLAGPTSGLAATSTFRKLVDRDLPFATATTIGGVSIPSAGGLSVNGVGAVSITNSVSPGTFPVVTYNAHGLITSGRALQSSDLPPAQPGSIGGVKAGDGITITPDGTLSQSTTGVAAGTYPKVTVDERGNVTAGMALEASDIPTLSINDLTGSISFSQIEGQLLTDTQLPDDSVESVKMADYASCYMQETTPGVADYLGQLWYQPSTAQLRVYGRGSAGDTWFPVGFGALQANNLRWGGTIDADTGKIINVTDIGKTEGIVAGNNIPAPSDEMSGLYFVVQVPGSTINHPAVSGDAFDAGDWLLCINATQGYVRIDTAASGGGGGGGGANYLNDLGDVTIGGSLALAGGQFLSYDQSNGMWVNTDVMDGGTF